MALTPFGFGRGAWDPSSALGDGMFDLFENFSVFDSQRLPSEVGAIATTRIDWVETPDSHIFKADLPGMKKEEIKIQVVDDTTLSISGERIREEVQETDTLRRVERSQGKFSRHFKLPQNANVEEISAKVENGVLTVTVPKLAMDSPTVRSIDIA